jgi:hypothetical protein
MKRLTFAVAIGSLLFVAALQVVSLQAQSPESFPTLEVQEPLNGTTPVPQPVPDPLTPQPATGQNVQQEKPSEFTKYPIRLLIKPDGIQFQQTQEEIATNQNAIPPNAFLLGCVTVNFKGAAGEPKPDFQLSCEDFLLMGSFGTQQNLDVKGASLSYSTQTQQIQLQGSDELPLEFHSVDAASETRMQADEIKLQLQPGGRPFIRRRSEESRVANEHVRVAASSFQVSAKNITALEAISNPAPKQDFSAGEDAPIWDPDAPSKSRDDNNIPFYDDPPKSSNNKYQRRNGPGFKPPPDAQQPPK